MIELNAKMACNHVKEVVGGQRATSSTIRRGGCWKKMRWATSDFSEREGVPEFRRLYSTFPCVAVVVVVQYIHFRHLFQMQGLYAFAEISEN